MLQQTQVSTVIPYFERFVRELPDLRALAAASEDRVFALWSGLGYYRRARYLREAARDCIAQHGGELPRDFPSLAALPGIGRSTAGAILALAHGERFAILDGNVKRVLTRFHGVDGWPGERGVEQRLWTLAERDTPAERVADYTQAIMDLGATVCTRARPRCGACPLAETCVAYRCGLADTLPQSRPARELPQKHTMMLVLADAQQRVLLQRRDARGVWSGLWSLPEAADRESADRLAASLARTSDTRTDTLPPFQHTFTHYRLHAQPLLWRGVRAGQAVADAPDQRWCTREDLVSLGIPAPVRKLLENLDRETVT
jgi:A/G-specific adenine glycosylase